MASPKATSRLIRPGIAVAGILAVAVVSASAEDAGVHAFLQAEARLRAPALQPARLAPPPWSMRAAPLRRVERRRAEPKTRFARLPAEKKAEAPAPVQMPVKAKDEIANPLPLLLRDETLRVGDIVVFPDGPRVFQGQPGDKHALGDFVKASKVKVASGARKALAALVVGRNDAWSAAPDAQVAARDVESTGSTRRASRARR